MIQVESPRLAVAISSAGYSSRAMRLLADRLRADLHPVGANSVWPYAASPDETSAVAARAAEQEARLVVVLLDRMWGHSADSAGAATALERRVDAEGAAFLKWVVLDDTQPPRWGQSAQMRRMSELGIDGLAQWLLSDATVAGRLSRGGARDVAARQATEERLARERDAFLDSPRALAVCAREFDRLTESVAKRIAALDKQTLTAKAEVRRAPARCIVQLGPVALTISWLRGGSEALTSGRLMVIEWSGVVARGSELVPERIARVPVVPAVMLREELMRAGGVGEVDWHWRCGESGVDGFASTDLAARCVESLLYRLEESQADPAYTLNRKSTTSPS